MEPISFDDKLRLMEAGYILPNYTKRAPKDLTTFPPEIIQAAKDQLQVSIAASGRAYIVIAFRPYFPREVMFLNDMNDARCTKCSSELFIREKTEGYVSPIFLGSCKTCPIRVWQLSLVD